MIVEYHREVKQNSEEDVKMIRRIIQIDREKCNGCGACAEACHEGAIAMVDGKAEKLTEIIRENDVKSVTVVRMEVPCCGGLERAAVTALKNSGKFIPWQVVTVTLDGRLKEE